MFGTSAIDWLGIIGLVAGLVSIGLAVVAIFLSFLFYRSARDDLGKIGVSAAKIEGLVNTITTQMIENVVGQSISGATRERAATPSHVDVVGRGASIAEAKRKPTKAFHEKALPAERGKVPVSPPKPEVAEAPQNVRSFILGILSDADAANRKTTVAELILAGASRFSGEAIVEEIFRLHDEGAVMWSEPDLSPPVQVVITKH